MRVIIMALFLFLTTGCVAQKREMPLDKKVAQMIILGFRGTEVTKNSSIISDIREKGIGGVLLFEHNIAKVERGIDSKEHLRKLCSDLQDASTGKLLISIDQEGGLVNRLKSKYGFPESVTAEYLGKLNNEDSSRYYYSRMAQQIKDLGINVNFAPNVDVNINPLCPVIGSKGRSYSDSVAIVNRHARIFIEEHRRSGVKTAIKHFPGHGSSLTDSHLGFTDVTQTWKSKELETFTYLINDSLCDMVMVSHTFNSNIDPVYPASLSHRTIDSLLRKTIGYNGIVVTDDMNMKAIAANYSFEQWIELTINAGVDMIILSNNIKPEDDKSAQHIVDTIVELVKKGRISYERIDEAYNRIIKFKGTL